MVACKWIRSVPNGTINHSTGVLTPIRHIEPDRSNLSLRLSPDHDSGLMKTIPSEIPSCNQTKEPTLKQKARAEA